MEDGEPMTKHSWVCGRNEWEMGSLVGLSDVELVERRQPRLVFDGSHIQLGWSMPRMPEPRETNDERGTGLKSRRQ